MQELTMTTSIEQLRADLDGRVITPDDEGYDQARAVFYRSKDRRPAAIVRPADASEVARVVTLARETGAELAIRSGGHSLAGHGVSEGGIVLDLRDLKGLELDAREPHRVGGNRADRGRVHDRGGGARPGDRVRGHRLGRDRRADAGRWRRLPRPEARPHDRQPLAAELVTADGELLRVDAEEHPDLFWAIRGGGGNFGVATRFHFRLHEVDTIVGGMLILPATPEVIASFVAEAEAAPEELSAIANIMIAPPMPFLPAEAHGKPVVMAL